MIRRLADRAAPAAVLALAAYAVTGLVLHGRRRRVVLDNLARLDALTPPPPRVLSWGEAIAQEQLLSAGLPRAILRADPPRALILRCADHAASRDHWAHIHAAYRGGRR